MLSSMLRSKRAVQVNVEIMCAFVRLSGLRILLLPVASRLFECLVPIRDSGRTSPTLGTGPRYSFLDRSILERYKVFMKTLTITDAKKNLGHWLAAAARGEDIGIVCGADIVALRKVDVESTDYAQREYGTIPEQVAALEKATEQRYRRLKRDKKLTSITAQELRKMLE